MGTTGTILVSEDQAAHRISLQQVLGHQGHTVMGTELRPSRRAVGIRRSTCGRWPP
ncbi:MAG: hypothetical protein QN201_03450 [Armatimonadota bacterium]|nr:hypothetical protein [Armatimonadota bacterium]